MAKMTITICNMENDKGREFVFAIDEFAYDFNDTHHDIINFLGEADWEVVDVEIESDLEKHIEKATCDYIEKYFTIDKEALEHLLEQIAELETEANSVYDVVTLWNDYCIDTMHSDDYIDIFNDSFVDDVCTDKMDAIYRCVFGDVNVNHTWAKLNGYANIVTTDYPIEDWMDVDDLVKWYINTCKTA